MNNYKNYFLILSVFLFGLQYFYTNADSTEEIIDESYKTRLDEIPKRVQLLTSIAYPDGVPETFLKYYTLPYVNSSSICSKHSIIYRDALKRFDHWAMQMIDSSGKIPSGILQGHFHDIGSYDECLETAKISPYPVQYCVVQYGNFIRLPKHSKFDWEKMDTTIGGLPVLKPRLHIGYCLPAACTRDDIKTNFIILFDKYNLTVHLNKYSCTASNEDSSFTLFEYFAGAVILILPTITIIASYLDVKYRKKWRNTTKKQVIECFSIFRNCKNLLQTSSPKRPLAVLNGIRFLSIYWIIFCHHWFFLVFKPTLNHSKAMELFSKPYAFMVLNGILAVDNFILLGGILQSYVFMKVMNDGMKFNLLTYYLHRIIRILPTYLIQILVSMTFLPRYFSSGPFGKDNIVRHKETCYENWWTNVLFINNYVNRDRQCIQSSWYLSVDMQLHFLSPLILFPLYKYKSFIKYGIPACISLSTLSPLLTAYIGQYPAGCPISSDLSTVNKYPYEYITTHTKLGCWFIGLGLGYLLFQHETKRIRLSRFVVRLGWALNIIVGTFTYASISYFHQEQLKYNRIIHSLYSGFASTIWGLCMAWLILACETGYGRTVHAFLSWRVFQPLGKLSFQLYMIHVGVQYINGATMKISQYFELIPQSIIALGEFAVTLMIAPLSSFFYESPFIELEKFLTGAKKRNNDRINNIDWEISKDSNRSFMKAKNESQLSLHNNDKPVTSGLLVPPNKNRPLMKK